MKEIDLSAQPIPQLQNSLKIITLSGFLIVSVFGGQRSLDLIQLHLSSHAPFLTLGLKAVCAIAFSLVNAAIILGLGVLGHEAIHRVLFKNLFLNNLYGSISGVLNLMPFYQFRDYHLQHHRHTHQPSLDPEEFINNRPIFLAIFGSGFSMLMIHYKGTIRNIMAASLTRRIAAIQDLLSIVSGWFLYLYVAPKMGISIALIVVPTIVFLSWLSRMRNVSEHHGIPAQVAHATKADRLDSWVVLTHPILAWLWSNINYHQVHHRYPHVSYRYLPTIFEATKDEQPYWIAKGYWNSMRNALQQNYYQPISPEKIYNGLSHQ